MAGSETPTQPWMPDKQARRRGPSDRVLIAILSAVVALLEGWRALVPAAQASPDAELARRMEGMEGSSKELTRSFNDFKTDITSRVMVLESKQKK